MVLSEKPRIELLNMDCMELMAKTPDKFYDLICTDPPYGVGLEYGLHDDNEKDWFNFMDKFIPEAKRIATMVVMPSCRIKALGYFYENHKPDWLICWYKGSPGTSAYIGFNDWEPLLVFGKTKGLQMHDYFKLTNTEKMGNYGHPCPKPIKWSETIIHNCLPNGGKVFEPFSGSGSCIIACYKLGFDITACELDKDYYKASITRFLQFSSQQTIKF